MGMLVPGGCGETAAPRLLGVLPAGAGDRSFAAQAPRVYWGALKAPLTLSNQRVAVLYGALLSP